MPSRRHDAGELALSLLAEMPVAERAEFLTAQLAKIGDLKALTEARNLLTRMLNELIDDQFGRR